MQHNVIILMGLPGAGKTSFANQLAMSREDVICLNINKVIEDDSWDEWKGLESISNNQYDAPNIIIDGRIYDEHIISKIINAWERNCSGSVYVILKWADDTEACIHNLTRINCTGAGFSQEDAEEMVYNANMRPFSSDIISGETGIDNISIIYRPTIDFTEGEEIINKEDSLSDILLMYSINSNKTN